jgi:hypothetical protein
LFSREWWRCRYPWAFVLIGPLLLFGWPLAKGDVLFWGTPLLQFVPWHRFALETLASGHLPLWNPLAGMGAPLLANYQSALLYPPNWLLARVGPAWGHGLLVFIHLVWAGAGMIVLARRLSLSPLAQSVAGVAFSLSGYLVARAGFLSINAAAAWLPWIIAAVEGGIASAEGRTRWSRAAVLLAIPLAMQWLAGHAQTSWYTLILCAAWATWQAARTRRLQSLLRAYGILALAGLLAFLLASAQLLPTLELLSTSQRSTTVDPELGLTYSLWPWRMLGWLFPDFFGNPMWGDYWGYGNYWEDALYLGVLPFALAVWAGVRSLRKKDPHSGLVRFLLIVSMAALVLALGKNTPLFPFLFKYVPTFSLFQAPTRWSLLTTFSLSLLAGVAVQNWTPLAGRGLYWARLGTAGAAVLGLAGWAAWMMLSGLELSMVRALALGGIWLSASGILALTRKRTESGFWQVAVAGVCVLDLVIAGWGMNPFTSADLYKGKTTLKVAVDDGHRIYVRPALEYELKFNRFFRFDAFAHGLDWRAVRESGLPNVSMLDRIPAATNFDPLVPERYALLMESLDKLPSTRQQQLFRWMDIGWLGLADFSLPEGIRYVKSEGASRVQLPSRVQWVGDQEQALAAVLAPDFDPAEVLVLEGMPSTAPGPPATVRSALILGEDDPNRVRLRVHTDGEAWVVLADVHHPGWFAEIDGEPASLLQADFLFRAVRVPAGAHVVDFIYSPASLRIGAALSLVGLLFLGAMVLRWRHD